MKPKLSNLIMGAVLVVLTGCGGGGDFNDLNAFVTEMEQRPKGRIEPLPPFTQVQPFAYQASNQRSPFEPPVIVKKVERNANGVKVKPDLNRVKEFLEQFPVGQLAMVGTLEQGANRFGLVQDGEGGVHRVRTGDYLGTDHGRIQVIGEGSIELIEIVSDGTGGWVERARTLALSGEEKG